MTAIIALLQDNVSLCRGFHCANPVVMFGVYSTCSIHLVKLTLFGQKSTTRTSVKQ